MVDKNQLRKSLEELDRVRAAISAQEGLLGSGVLLVASAGVMEHSGIKIPFFAFFGHDSGIRCKEAPLNMLVAMGITASVGLLAAAMYWLAGRRLMVDLDPRR